MSFEVDTEGTVEDRPALSVLNLKLDQLEEQYWANAILYRLAYKLGLVNPENADPVEVDPDELLEDVEERLDALAAYENEI